jgi:hypothetical protein
VAVEVAGVLGEEEILRRGALAVAVGRAKVTPSMWLPTPKWIRGRGLPPVKRATRAAEATMRRTRARSTALLSAGHAGVADWRGGCRKA